MSPKELTEKILASKKYRRLYPKTVERIAEDCLKKYGPKEAEKKTKKLLHQVWGVFYPRRPNFDKLFQEFKKNIEKGQNIKKAVLPILRLHQSTRERIPVLDDFYRKLLEVTGQPKSVLDLAAGLNPLTFFWLPPGTKYYSYDIDQEQTCFLKSIFAFLRAKNVKIELGDVFTDCFPRTDVVFLLKILPLIRLQEKNKLLEIIARQKAKWVVASFPTKTVSGRNKGMTDFYTRQFNDLIKGQPWTVKEILFPNELVFIVKKHD